MTILAGYAALGAGARALGTVGVGFLLLACLLLIAVSRRTTWSLTAVLFAFVVATYAILSPYETFVRSWTRHLEVELIWRQAVFFIALPFTLAAFDKIWQRLCGIGPVALRSLALIVSSFLIITPMLQHMVDAESDGLSFWVPNLINTSMGIFLLTAWIGLVLLPERRGIAFSIGAGLALAPLCQNAQTSVLALLLPIMALTRRPITTALLFCACLFLLVGLIIYVGPIEIAEYDVNSAVRSIDWRNALTGFVESDYMGIGLGTESVANYYSALDRSERYTEDQALLVSVHNVFLYCFFKFGLFGGILFLLFVFVDCRPRRTQNKRLDRFTAYSFCCALATLSVNVAVESPLFYFGTIFALAGARLGHSSSPRATVAGQSQ